VNTAGVESLRCPVCWGTGTYFRDLQDGSYCVEDCPDCRGRGVLTVTR
jgi:DnaJ-class molecular chaperone